MHKPKIYYSIKNQFLFDYFVCPNNAIYLSIINYMTLATLDIENIVTNFILQNDNYDYLKGCVLSILKYCDSLIMKNITEKTLCEYMFIINYLYKTINALQIINSTKFIAQLDEIVTNYNNAFFNNDKIYTQIKKLAKNDKCGEKDAFTKVLKIFNEKHDKKITKFISSINAIKNKINEKIYDKCSYSNIQKNTSNPHDRIINAKMHAKKVNNCVDLLQELILVRHSYAQYMGFDNYYAFLHSTCFNEKINIKQLINELMFKIDKRTHDEIDRIKRELQKDGINKHVEIHDMIYYRNKLKTQHLFTPSKIIKIIINCIKQYFNIDFVKQTNELYFAMNNNIKIGEIYFQIKSGKSLKPTCIHLCHNYIDINNKKHCAKIIIIGNYKNVGKECMTLSDVILLFREFGTILQYLAYQLPACIVLDHNEYESLFPNIMEYIAWEKNTISKICANLPSDIIDHVLFTRYIDFGFTIKLKCIDALFDCIIHESTSMIDMINNANGNINQIYCNLFEKTMVLHKNIFNTNIENINAKMIMQETNDYEGFIYQNIYTEILSFGIFDSIKKGNGYQFFNTIMNVNPTQIKQSLDKFKQTQNIDCTYMYLKDIEGYNEIDTEVNMEIKNTNNEHIKQPKQKIRSKRISKSIVNYFGSDSSDVFSSANSDSGNIVYY